jgi:hypothetical protein
MIDVFNIPSSTQNTITFYATGNWQTWNKPRNAKMIEIFCLGGGAGGGQHTVSTGNSFAGGGGASGGIVRGLIPAFLLPDTIYILVGKGGAGPSTSATAGGVGNISYVALQTTTSEQTLICKSSTTTPGGGGAAAGAGGAPTISVVSLSAFGNLGLFTAIAGVAGTTGALTTTGSGTNQPALGTSIVTGGCGGGGKGSAGVFGTGGNITSASAVLTNQVNGGQTEGADGGSGYGTLQPFCGTGGAGGAGRGGTTGTGGRGGDGWYGCGGGGTGGGSVVTKAGNGGDGLVIITVIS